MLAEDAKMTMPPLPSWYSGREQITAFLRGFALASGRNAERAAINRATNGAVAQTLTSIVVVLILIDMIWKPGA